MEQTSEAIKLIRAEVIKPVTVYSGFKQPGDIVEVDEQTFANLERKGRLKLATEEAPPKPKRCSRRPPGDATRI